MGKFGSLISQCDEVYNLVGVLLEGMCLNDLYLKKSYYQPYKKLFESIDEYVLYHLDSLDYDLFSIALAVESINKGSVCCEYYAPVAAENIM